LSPESS